MPSASSSISTKATIDWRGWLRCGLCSGTMAVCALDSPSASPTARRPSAGARASRAYAAPSPAARACGQSSAPAGIRTAGGDADINGDVAGHPATNRNAAGSRRRHRCGISTPKLELGSQPPRCVVICTVQPPSNDVRACACSGSGIAGQHRGSDVKRLSCCMQAMRPISARREPRFCQRASCCDEPDGPLSSRHWPHVLRSNWGVWSRPPSRRRARAV